MGQGLALGSDKPHPCEPGAGEEGQEEPSLKQFRLSLDTSVFRPAVEIRPRGGLDTEGRNSRLTLGRAALPEAGRGTGGGRAVPAGLQVLPEPPSKVLGGGSGLKQNGAVEKWSSFENDD